MSDDRADRYLKAIVEASYVSLLASHTASAVMAVADEELQQLEDALSKERARAEVAEQQRDDWRRATASYSRQTADHLDSKAEAEQQRDLWEASARAIRSECDQRAADAVRLRADLLTARHDRDEFYSELLATRKELEEARAASALWKELAEKHDASAAPLRHQLRTAGRERDRALQARDGASRNAEYYRGQLEALDNVDVDDLKATIVAQARRLAKLEGEA
ncbi:hypothetical protein GCM10009548_01940 [Streptomyces malaysiensis subsp. malaysiensis]|uniref:PspA/IM30 family protein n=1 Tax=Streptomyces malaysiensis TaxID=92644 RepID=A0ABX6W5K2_STRMQ|nr:MULTISPECIES: hypothetical protein [Streptomyces]QPI56341.1 hypothetical protein I1A49_16580 [Streptomyces solisilvae]UHH17828.1 hypothetical protein LUV23_16695 [Streptomyces sp. HNM0561]